MILAAFRQSADTAGPNAATAVTLKPIGTYYVFLTTEIAAIDA